MKKSSKWSFVWSCIKSRLITKVFNQQFDKHKRGCVILNTGEDKGWLWVGTTHLKKVKVLSKNMTGWFPNIILSKKLNCFTSRRRLGDFQQQWLLPRENCDVVTLMKLVTLLALPTKSWRQHSVIVWNWRRSDRSKRSLVVCVFKDNNHQSKLKYCLGYPSSKNFGNVWTMKWNIKPCSNKNMGSSFHFAHL